MSPSNVVADLVRLLEAQGALLLTAQDRDFDDKPGAGLVTELDRQIEGALRKALPAMAPGSVMVGEERGGTPAEWTWWVDPLDGTTNFVHSWPRSALSVALYRGDIPLLCAVRDPYRDETFWAIAGEGAWCGSRRLQVSGCSKLEQALLSTGFAPHPPQQWAVCQELQSISHGLRISGCASLDLAYVACGRGDAFWEVDLKPWDVAAGLLLVREAGGLTRDFAGKQATLTSANYLAGTPALVGPLLQRLAVVKV
jgi:myo-inositol-1(or 4)-monophosphatase